MVLAANTTEETFGGWALSNVTLTFVDLAPESEMLTLPPSAGAEHDPWTSSWWPPASLDDISQTAGYTKGAIYKHFATKEDLFLAVSDRYWRRYFDNFAEVMSTSQRIEVRELDEIARRWRQLSRDRGAEHAALGLEFTLYLLRNPDARKRVAAKRSEVVEALAKFIVEGIDRLGERSWCLR